MGVVDTSTLIMTFTNGSTVIAAGSEVCIQFGTNATEGVTGVEQITNATSAASFDLAFTGTFGDTGTIVITTVTDDAVVTTATVLASLSFSISDNDIFFGDLSSTASKWADNTADGNATAVAAHTLIAGTNSTSGYTITVNGATLASIGTPADTIDAMLTEATLTTAQEEFGLRITAAGGACASTAVDAVYDDTPANSYALVDTAFPDTIVACTSASADTTYSLFYAANIASDTEAHTDYSSTLTYIATGNF